MSKSKGLGESENFNHPHNIYVAVKKVVVMVRPDWGQILITCTFRLVVPRNNWRMLFTEGSLFPPDMGRDLVLFKTALDHSANSALTQQRNVMSCLLSMDSLFSLFV